MQNRGISILLSAALLLGGFTAVAAEETKSAATPASATKSKTESTKASAQTKKATRVDINSATAAQLKTVPGIGETEAQRIIIHRPYPTRSHLVTKNVLSYDAYMALKDRIVAVPPVPAKAKK